MIKNGNKKYKPIGYLYLFKYGIDIYGVEI